MRLVFSAILGLGLGLAGSAPFAMAQHDHGRLAAENPYKDIIGRAVKSYSEQQLADLKAGRGMGLSLPAELNGYPGPKHVLELAAQLDLTPEQRQLASSIVQRMTSQAIELGEQLIAEEQALDARFASGQASENAVREAAKTIALLQARLRMAHLNAHLQMTAGLTPTQVKRYASLRGYMSK